MTYTLKVNDGRTTETHLRCTLQDVTDAIAWLNGARNGHPDDTTGWDVLPGPGGTLTHAWDAAPGRRAMTLVVRPNPYG